LALRLAWCLNPVLSDLSNLIKLRKITNRGFSFSIFAKIYFNDKIYYVYH
jgi:hypothetical protein